MPTIDPKSVASLAIVPYSFSVPVGFGTGFIVSVEGVNLLITNYHVLSGRHPNTGQQLGSDIPDRIIIPQLSKKVGDLQWHPVVQKTYDFGQPLWSEHPSYGRRFDVVALPITVPLHCQIVPYPFDSGQAFYIGPSSDVTIVGFPEGMSASGLTAIWKSGSVASEPDLDVNGEEYFWIDSNTRKGMSGSPVIARRTGSSAMEAGGSAIFDGSRDRTVGVYAGRAFDAQDMTLGRVWKWAGVQEVIKSAVSKVQRGVLKPHPCSIGYIYQPEENMVSINILNSVQVPTVNNGQQVLMPINTAQIFRDFILNDQRFGINLERVKMAAKLAAKLDVAITDGTPFEVDDNEYAIIRESIETPSAPYNAALARHILPLLEAILAAGQNEQAQNQPASN